MALNPAQTDLVVLLNRDMDEYEGSNRRCFFRVNTSDGRPVGRAVCMEKLSYGKDQSLIMVNSQSLFWDPYDQIYAVFSS